MNVTVNDSFPLFVQVFGPMTRSTVDVYLPGALAQCDTSEPVERPGLGDRCAERIELAGGGCARHAGSSSAPLSPAGRLLPHIPLNAKAWSLEPRQYALCGHLIKRRKAIHSLRTTWRSALADIRHRSADRRTSPRVAMNDDRQGSILLRRGGHDPGNDIHVFESALNRRTRRYRIGGVTNDGATRWTGRPWDTV